MISQGSQSWESVRDCAWSNKTYQTNNGCKCEPQTENNKNQCPKLYEDWASSHLAFSTASCMGSCSTKGLFTWWQAIIRPKKLRGRSASIKQPCPSFTPFTSHTAHYTAERNKPWLLAFCTMTFAINLNTILVIFTLKNFDPMVSLIYTFQQLFSLHPLHKLLALCHVLPPVPLSW